MSPLPAPAGAQAGVQNERAGEFVSCEFPWFRCAPPQAVECRLCRGSGVCNTGDRYQACDMKLVAEDIVGINRALVAIVGAVARIGPTSLEAPRTHQSTFAQFERLGACFGQDLRGARQIAAWRG
jgi:hypothetical protein